MFCFLITLFSQEIGEEFVEFLEKELNISDEDSDDGSSKNGERFDFEESSKSPGNNSNSTKNSIEDNIDEIEATLAQLKKDLGLQ